MTFDSNSRRSDFIRLPQAHLYTGTHTYTHIHITKIKIILKKCSTTYNSSYNLNVQKQYLFSDTILIIWSLIVLLFSIFVIKNNIVDCDKCEEWGLVFIS